MTIKECLNKMVSHTNDAMARYNHGEDVYTELRKNVRADLRALILTETERCAAVLDNEADECGEIQVAGLLRSCAEQLLATPPGKGGG